MWSARPPRRGSIGCGSRLHHLPWAGSVERCASGWGTSIWGTRGGAASGGYDWGILNGGSVRGTTVPFVHAIGHSKWWVNKRRWPSKYLWWGCGPRCVQGIVMGGGHRVGVSVRVLYITIIVESVYRFMEWGGGHRRANWYTIGG